MAATENLFVCYLVSSRAVIRKVLRVAALYKPPVVISGPATLVLESQVPPCPQEALWLAVAGTVRNARCGGSGCLAFLQ